MDYILVMGKAVLFFVVALIGFRLMGNQAVGRLTAFDLVIVIAIGAMIGAPLADKDLNPLIGITGILTLVVIQMITSFLTLKSKWLSKIAIGEPIKIVENGKLVEKGLRQARLTKNNVLEELRIKGITKVSDVEMAYLEPEGKVSVIPKKEKNKL